MNIFRAFLAALVLTVASVGTAVANDANPMLFVCYNDETETGIYLVVRQTPQGAAAWVFDGDGMWVNQASFVRNDDTNLWMSMVNNTLLVLEQDDTGTHLTVGNPDATTLTMTCR